MFLKDTQTPSQTPALETLNTPQNQQLSLFNISNLNNLDSHLEIPRKSNQTYQAISLFSGCGGMNLGFMGNFNFLGYFYQKLPIETIWANEAVPPVLAWHLAKAIITSLD